MPDENSVVTERGDIVADIIVQSHPAFFVEAHYRRSRDVLRNGIEVIDRLPCRGNLALRVGQTVTLHEEWFAAKAHPHGHSDNRRLAHRGTGDLIHSRNPRLFGGGHFCRISAKRSQDTAYR